MPDISTKELVQDVRQAIEDLRLSARVESVGVVTRVSDGVAWIYGLPACGYNEVLEQQGIGVSVAPLGHRQDQVGRLVRSRLGHGSAQATP